LREETKIIEEDSKFASALTGISNKKLLSASETMPEDIMNEDDLELVRQCEGLFEYARRNKQPAMERAKRSYLLYSGKQWSGISPTYKPRPVSNKIYATIEYEVPLMTENLPIIIAQPRNPEDFSSATGATKALQWVFDDNHMAERLPDISRNFLIMGDDFLKIYWDFSEGRIRMDSIELDNIYPEPGKSSCKELNWYIHAEPRPIYEITNMYPNGKYVRPESNITVIEEANEDAPSGFETKESLMAEGMATGKRFGEDLFCGRAVVKELWIKDRTMITKEHVVLNDDGTIVYEMDEDGKDYKYDDNGEPIPKKYYTKEAKYPNGRIITWANGVLLVDAPFPCEIGGRAPLVQFRNTKIRRNFWSWGEPYQLEDIQKQLNKRKAQVDFLADLTGNAVWIVDADSGVKRHNLTNQPGLVIYKRPGSEVRRESPPPAPEYLFRSINDLKEEADSISGIAGIMYGEKPGSVSAANAIDALIERALVRVKLKVKYMEDTLIEAGAIVMKLIRQFWEEPRQFVITGKTLFDNPEVVEFSGLQLKTDPDIKIVAGSSMPTSKTTKFEQAVIMLRLNVIDREEFLKYIEYPNAEAIVQRMNEKEQQQQEMMIQQQQQQVQAALMKEQLKNESKLQSENLKQRGALTSEVLRQRGKLFNDIVSGASFPDFNNMSNNNIEPSGVGAFQANPNAAQGGNNGNY